MRYDTFWDTFKNGEGQIDLIRAYEAHYGGNRLRFYDAATLHLYEIMELQPQVSRQSAAVAIVTARHLQNLEDAAYTPD